MSQTTCGQQGGRMATRFPLVRVYIRMQMAPAHIVNRKSSTGRSIETTVRLGRPARAKRFHAWRQEGEEKADKEMQFGRR